MSLINELTYDQSINMHKQKAKKKKKKSTLPALCRERMAARMLAGGGEANTPPATAADSIPAPRYPEDNRESKM